MSSRPTDLPPADRFEHGTRARYVTGCRCDACRNANRLAYHARKEKARAAAVDLGAGGARGPCPGVNGTPCPWSTKLRKDSGPVCSGCRDSLVWNGLVSAEKARAHLVALGEQGVGRRAVAAAADVSETILMSIRQGTKWIRKDTEQKILAVDAGAVADHAIVPAKETWRRIRELLRLGYTRGELAQRLGAERPALQLRKREVLARTALRVEKLHREIMGEIEREKSTPAICPDCGYSHAPEERQRLIARMVRDGLTAPEIAEAWPCFYPDVRTAYRDAKAVRPPKAP